jgi:site-specific DNA recombinase
MAMGVALYIRVSTQRQAQAQTVEQQIERLVNEARQQGWEVPLDQIFRDDGYSGASLRRPGLDRLRDRAAACALDLILITAPDRLARNYPAFLTRDLKVALPHSNTLPHRADVADGVRMAGF